MRMVKYRRCVIVGCLIFVLWACPVQAGEGLFFKGEKVTYAIKKFGVNAGEASLEFKGEDKVNGKKVFLIMFKAVALNFYDEEKIYVDTETFYPVMVVRDLDIWGKKEQIVEEYVHDQGLVKITKTVKGETTEQVIKKKEQIDNIYCFIYRFRQRGVPKEGDEFEMFLPTKDIKIKYIKEMKLKAAGEQYDSYQLQTDPKQYAVWFDTSEQMIPLRIDGGTGLVSSSLVMSEYVAEPSD